MCSRGTKLPRHGFLRLTETSFSFQSLTASDYKKLANTRSHVPPPKGQFHHLIEHTENFS